MVSVSFPPELAGVPLTLNMPDRRFCPAAAVPVAPMYEKNPVNPCSVNPSPVGQLRVLQPPSELVDTLRVKLASVVEKVPNEVGTRNVNKSWPVPVIVTVPAVFRIVNWARPLV